MRTFYGIRSPVPEPKYSIECWELNPSYFVRPRHPLAHTFRSRLFANKASQTEGGTRIAKSTRRQTRSEHLSNHRFRCCRCRRPPPLRRHTRRRPRRRTASQQPVPALQPPRGLSVSPPGSGLELGTGRWNASPECRRRPCLSPPDTVQTQQVERPQCCQTRAGEGGGEVGNDALQ